MKLIEDEMGEPRRNLGALTDHSRNRNAVAIVDCSDPDRHRLFTHGQVDDLANAWSRGLLKRGMRRGESVAILAANRIEFLVAYLGTMRAGLVAVPVNHKLPRESVEFILRDCSAALVVCDSARAQLVPEGVANVDMDGTAWDAFLDPGEFDPVVPGATETAMILYTSGSTGRPKGVLLSHEGQWWAVRSRMKARRSFEDECLIIAAPLFHMNALASIKFALAAHASVVLLPQFDPVRFIDAISRYRVTWITSVPTMMAMVLREKDALTRSDLSCVRYVRMGSSAATEQLHAAVQRQFPGATVSGGYGTTEAGPVVFGPLPGCPVPKGACLGWPQPGVEVRLVRDDGGEGNEGVLWMRTPANMTGYLNLPEKTREVLTPDGWYISGDILRRAEDGSYFFVGRADDMFVSGGENIYPGDVEHMLERHPSILQACVVPVDDEIKGQKPVAFVVRSHGSEITEQEVKGFALAHAPAYQHPRRVFFLESLPLAATNKIDRRTLIAMAASFVRSGN